MIASSGSIWLSEQPKDPESNARTVQTSSLVSAESGPAVSGSRADGRHDARRSSVDQAESPEHQQLNHAGHTCHAMTRVARALGLSRGGGPDTNSSIKYRRTDHIAPNDPKSHVNEMF